MRRTCREVGSEISQITALSLDRAIDSLASEKVADTRRLGLLVLDQA